MTNRPSFSFFLISLSLLFTTLTASMVAQTRLDRIVAVVDKEIITESELMERVMLTAMQNRLDPADTSLRVEVLNGLIAEKLVLAQAIIDSILVSDADVTRQLDSQIDNFIRRAGSQERLEQIYGMPLARIKRESRDIMRKQMLVSKARQAKEGSIQVARREVEEFFQTYKDSLPHVPQEFDLRHIFVVPKADSSVEQQTRAVMVGLLDSLRNGKDFAALAKRYSQDGSAASGGELPWAKRGEYVHEFEEAIFGLKENQISDIVKTQFGFHIIQLIERRGESVRARHILLKIEKGAASDSAAVRFLRGLRERALNGESFTDLAKKYSEDEETKALGGDLGTMSVDQMQPDFSAVVADLKTGDISQPHRVAHGASYGFQIALVKKRTEQHAPSLEADFKRIELIALQLKRARLGEEWINELKKRIYCDIRINR
jgi:peptidyl-prolyl cis-trans isomerase SurA